MIFNIYMYNRQGTCIYFHEWNLSKKRKAMTPANRTEDQKLMYGLIFSLKQFTTNIAPRPSEVFYGYKTDTYKLHYFETTTGFKLVLLTDPNVGDLREQLRHIYSQIFVELVIKNPLYKPNTIVKCIRFESALDKYIKNLFCFN